MKDESKFQIGAKTTVVFDDFLYDSENQKLRARIIDGALAYDAQKNFQTAHGKLLLTISRSQSGAQNLWQIWPVISNSTFEGRCWC